MTADEQVGQAGGELSPPTAGGPDGRSRPGRARRPRRAASRRRARRRGGAGRRTDRRRGPGRPVRRLLRGLSRFDHGRHGLAARARRPGDRDVPRKADLRRRRFPGRARARPHRRPGQPRRRPSSRNICWGSRPTSWRTAKTASSSPAPRACACAPKSVVITGGLGTFTPRPLPTGSEYLGRGLAYFVPKPDDYAGLDVLVVGGGDSALDWALSLEPLARSVTVVHRRQGFRAHEHTVSKVLASSVAGARWTARSPTSAVQARWRRSRSCTPRPARGAGSTSSGSSRPSASPPSSAR